jgi:hypothetical protein
VGIEVEAGQEVFFMVEKRMVDRSVAADRSGEEFVSAILSLSSIVRLSLTLRRMLSRRGWTCSVPHV